MEPTSTDRFSGLRGDGPGAFGDRGTSGSARQFSTAFGSRRDAPEGGGAFGGPRREREEGSGSFGGLRRERDGGAFSGPRRDAAPAADASPAAGGKFMPRRAVTSPAAAPERAPEAAPASPAAPSRFAALAPEAAPAAPAGASPGAGRFGALGGDRAPRAPAFETAPASRFAALAPERPAGGDESGDVRGGDRGGERAGGGAFGPRAGGGGGFRENAVFGGGGRREEGGAFAGGGGGRRYEEGGAFGGRRDRDDSGAFGGRRDRDGGGYGDRRDGGGAFGDRRFGRDGGYRTTGAANVAAAVGVHVVSGVSVVTSDTIHQTNMAVILSKAADGARKKEEEDRDRAARAAAEEAEEAAIERRKMEAAKAEYGIVGGGGAAVSVFKRRVVKALDDFLASFDGVTAASEVRAALNPESGLSAIAAVTILVDAALSRDESERRNVAELLVALTRAPTKKVAAVATESQVAAGLGPVADRVAAAWDASPAAEEEAARFVEVVEEVLRSTEAARSKKGGGGKAGSGEGGVSRAALGKSTAALMERRPKTEVTKLREREEAEEAARAAAALEEQREAERRQAEEVAAAKKRIDDTEAGRETPAQKAANEAVASGKLGEELAATVRETVFPHKSDGAAALMAAVLKAANERGQVNSKCAWLNKDQYGAALAVMCYGRGRSSVAALFALQYFFHTIGFPIGDKGISVLERVFRKLYDQDIVEEEPMMAWRNDVHNPTPGHAKALVDTADFLDWLENAEEEGEEDEEELDGVVRPENRRLLK